MGAVWREGVNTTQKKKKKTITKIIYMGVKSASPNGCEHLTSQVHQFGVVEIMSKN